MTTTTINRRPDHDHWHSHDHDHNHDHDHDHAVSVVGSARSAERTPTGHTVVFDIGDGIGVHTGVWRRVMNGNDVVIVSGEIADLDLRTAPAAS